MTKQATPDDERLFWNLKRWGAPLSRKGLPGRRLSLEETLAFSCGLARRNPAVAMVWPVVFAKGREAVDLTALEALSRDLGHERVLGFFMTVTQQLLGDLRLARFLRRLRNGTHPELEQFFLMGQGRLYRELAERNTPREAREWGFSMNTSVGDFRTCFDKFVKTHAPILQ